MTRVDIITLSGFPLAFLLATIVTGYWPMLLLFGVYYFIFLDMLTWPDRGDN
jgi:hypothetical protein